ncbi:MAG: DUF47 family protein [Candidatus Methanomethylicia archaeon]|nr:DUF47 family protein [Candidatus Methanomethylicia archaeon]
MWKRISSIPLSGVEEEMRGHLKLVCSSVSLLRDLASASESGNWSLVNSVAERIAMIEREADDMQRRTELKLYKGSIFIGLKEDFLRLYEAIDEIADKSKDASRALASREPEGYEIKILNGYGAEIRKMVEGTIEGVEMISDAILLLNKDATAALKKAHEVEKLEERLDDIKLSILKDLARDEKRLSTLTYLQVRDFIFLLDMVADASERASDVITAMIVKSGA